MIGIILRVLTVIGTIYIVVRWWLISDTAGKLEPILCLFTIVMSILTEIYSHYSSKFITLRAGPHAGPLSIFKKFDFTKETGKIIIRPTQFQPITYWRAGFLFSENSNLSVHSHLQSGTALFTVEQTESEFTCSLHVDTARTREIAIVSRNYHGEDIKISYKMINSEIVFTVFIENEQVYKESFNTIKRYGRFVAFSDQYSFEIKVKKIRFKEWLSL